MPDRITTHSQNNLPSTEFESAGDFGQVSESRIRYVVSRRNTALGDCLVSLFSAWLYARATGRSLIIDWRFSIYSKGEPANLFNQLFEPIESIDGVDIYTDQDILGECGALSIYPSDRKLNEFCPNSQIDPHRCQVERIEMLNLIRFTRQRDEDVVVFDHCLNWDEMLFTSTSRFFFQQLVPLKPLRDRIADFQVNNFDGLPVVGVHIRHGNGGNIMDHAKYWTDTVLERCATTIFYAIASVKTRCRVFLATDSTAVERHFESIFLDLSKYKKYFRKEGEGELHHASQGKQIAQDALVDLYLLSRANILIRFPGGSFFSQVSAQLRPAHNRFSADTLAALSVRDSNRQALDPEMDFRDSFKKRSCLITFRDDGKGRRQNLHYVLNHLSADPDLELVLVEQDERPSVDQDLLPPGCQYRFVPNSGLFNKSWGLNIAADISGGEVLVMHDADIVLDLDVLREAMTQIDSGIDAVNPYDMLVDLGSDETDSLLKGEPELEISRSESEINRLYKGQVIPFAGGIFIVRREYFYSIGGMDERFSGWGCEDNAISERILGNTTRLQSVQGRIAYHLWHQQASTASPQSSPEYIRNLALIGAYHEQGHNLLEQYRLDIGYNGDPDKYLLKSRKIKPTLVPLVSCLCVTRDRVGMLRRSIACFRNQSWLNRELLIICDDDDSATVQFVISLNDPQIRYHITAAGDRQNLGQLRNLSIKLAHGEYFCQWDDDDWFDPRRISKQMMFIRENDKAASILPRWQIYSAVHDQAFLSNVRLWEGSLLCRTDVFNSDFVYAESDRGEEAPMVRHLLVTDQLAVVDCPELYVYCFSGNNTWDLKHFDRIMQHSRPLNGDARDTIKYKIERETEQCGSPGIPRIIHQTAATGILSQPYRQWQQTVVEMHPDWDYRFYDNAQCRQVIVDMMPELLDCYDRLPRDIQRVDLFRLVAVYLHGGFYIDLDVELKQPLDPLVMHDCVFAEEKTLSKECRQELGHTHGLRVANYMFAAAPRHPFIACLIMQVAEHALNREIEVEDDVLESTGPAMLTSQYHDYAHKQDITLLGNNGNLCPRCKSGCCAFGDYAAHHHLGSWRWQHSSQPRVSPSVPAVKIIHQTWKTAKLPEMFARLAETWKVSHPGWQYCLWTDQDNRNLIETHYPWFLDIYDGYPHNIQRADAARYFILYSVGGLYADLDFRSYRCIEPLIDQSELILGLEHPSHHEIHQKSRIIGNAFIYASSSGSPFLRKVIEELVACADIPVNGNDYVLESTGPFMLSRVYENYVEKGAINLLPCSDLYPLEYSEAENLLADPEKEEAFARTAQAYAAHYHCGSWWKKGSDLINS